MEISVIFQTMSIQMKQSFSRSMFRYCLLVNPVVNTILLFEMFKYNGGNNISEYIILSAGMMGIWGCMCFSSIGDIGRERYSGTLPLLYVSPVGFNTVVMGKILGNTILSLLTFVISFVLTAILCDEKIAIINLSGFLLSFLTMIICFEMLGLCIAYILMRSRKTELYMNLLEVPFELVCGFAFPIEVLPEWLQVIAKMFPVTWNIKIMRFYIYGAQTEKIERCWIYLVVEMLLLVVITRIVYERVKREIQINATLEVS